MGVKIRKCLVTVSLTDSHNNILWKTEKFAIIHPAFRIFPNMAPHLKDAPFCLLLSCKKLWYFWLPLSVKMSKIPNFDNPFISVKKNYKFQPCHFFLLNSKFFRKTDERSLKILKTKHDPQSTNQQMDQKADHFGTHWVIMGFKIIQP